ncbi:MAG TPA: hypothetical protein VF845_12325 [Terriglobales bacterium]
MRLISTVRAEVRGLSELHFFFPREGDLLTISFYEVKPILGDVLALVPPISASIINSSPAFLTPFADSWCVFGKSAQRG